MAGVWVSSEASTAKQHLYVSQHVSPSTLLSKRRRRMLIYLFIFILLYFIIFWLGLGSCRMFSGVPVGAWFWKKSHNRDCAAQRKKEREGGGERKTEREIESWQRRRSGQDGIQAQLVSHHRLRPTDRPTAWHHFITLQTMEENKKRLGKREREREEREVKGQGKVRANQNPVQKVKQVGVVLGRGAAKVASKTTWCDLTRRNNRSLLLNLCGVCVHTYYVLSVVVAVAEPNLSCRLVVRGRAMSFTSSRVERK